MLSTVKSIKRMSLISFVSSLALTSAVYAGGGSWKNALEHQEDIESLTGRCERALMQTDPLAPENIKDEETKRKNASKRKKWEARARVCAALGKKKPLEPQDYIALAEAADPIALPLPAMLAVPVDEGRGFVAIDVDPAPVPLTHPLDPPIASGFPGEIPPSAPMFIPPIPPSVSPEASRELEKGITSIRIEETSPLDSTPGSSSPHAPVTVDDGEAPPLDFRTLRIRYNGARSTGNAAPAADLTGYLVGPTWGVLSVAQKAQVIAEVSVDIGSIRRGYVAVRSSGNGASNEELVGFLLKQAGFIEWDALAAPQKAYMIAQVSLNVSFIKRQYQAARDRGNTASNEELVGYLLKQAGFIEWDALAVSQKTYIIARIIARSDEEKEDTTSKLVKKITGGRSEERIRHNVDTEVQRGIESVKNFLDGNGLKHDKRLKKDKKKKKGT